MADLSSRVDSTLERIRTYDHGRRAARSDRSRSYLMLQDLRDVEKFVEFAGDWSGADEAVREHLEQLVGSIDQLFETAISELGVGDAEEARDLENDLYENLKLIKSRIQTDEDFSSTWEMCINHKKNPYSSSLDSAVDMVKKAYYIHSYAQWNAVQKGLVLIQTFPKFVQHWIDTDKVVCERLGYVVRSIDNAFKTSYLDLENVIRSGDCEYLYVVYSKMLMEIEILKPRIREAYDFLSDYAFQITTPLPPNVLAKFFRALFGGELRVVFDIDFTCAYPGFVNIVRAVVYFAHHSSELSDERKQLWALNSLMQGGAICLARILLLWAADEMPENDVMNMISDVLQRIKPTSPDILHLYLADLSAKGQTSVLSLNHLVDMILPCKKRSLQTFRNGLYSLLEYLIKTYTEELQDTKQLRFDIEKVVCDSASLNYYLPAATANNDQEDLFFDSLRKIECVEEEVVLTRLTTDSCKSESISALFFESISLAKIFCKCSENSSFIFKRMEQVARDAECLHLLLQEGNRREALKFKLFLDFKLMKLCFFLTEQVRFGLSWSVEEKLNALDQGLQLLFKYLSFLPSENEGYEQLILTFIETLAKEDTPPYYLPQSHHFPEHTINQISVFLCCLIQKVYIMNSKIQDIAHLFRRSLPKTHQGLGFVDIVLKKQRGLIKYNADKFPNHSLKHGIEAVQKELYTWRSFPLMIEVGEKKKTHPKLMSIWRRITRAAFEADHIIDCILLTIWNWKHIFCLSVVIDEMKILNSKLLNFVQMKNDSSDLHVAAQQVIITQDTSTPQAGEDVVSLEDEEKKILEKLIRGKKREVVTISGMAGIGKTTLARRVYDHSRIKNHFNRLAWCCVSQVYQKRDLLLKLLSDVTESNSDEMEKKDDDELLDMLYKGLKRNRYFVVMDDVWSNQAWEELEIAFSDDLNGSRVLVTTRNVEVGLNIEPHVAPHNLRFLNEDESWKLLKKKVFHMDKCPEDLLKVGLEIAKGCKGLPMAIIAIAGLLKTSELNVELWENIERELNSHIFESPEIQCMHILELSYNHLPDVLKPCFLYFAAFGEDNEVHVHKLIQLWIAEGFVGEVNDHKISREDVAQSYLTNLIGRSLLMVVKKGSSGKVKACKVHDMVYNLCVRKAEVEKFLQYINGYEILFPSSSKQLDYGDDSNHSSIPVSYHDQHRLSICSKRKHLAKLKPAGPSVRTLLFFATSDSYPKCPYDNISSIARDFDILSILDIETINMGHNFLRGIEFLYPLRYLAISGDIKHISSDIANLWNLETFIVKGLTGKVELPDTLWSMSKLRHLHVTTQAIFKLLDGSHESSSELNNMVSLSCPALLQGDTSEEVMKLFPKLRKLRCTFSESVQHSEESIGFPVLDFLKNLESLKVIYYGSLSQYCQLKGVMFPPNLKKLSLSDFTFTWDDFSVIGKLPHLNVMKLVAISFDKPTWKMEDDEFQELEYLKLDSLKVVDWEAEREHLPNLQQLVLQRCIRLKEVPSSFGDITTLKMVELKWCSVSAEKSVMKILEQQLESENREFKALINGVSYSQIQSDAQATDEVLTLQQEIERLAKEYGIDELKAVVDGFSWTNVTGEVPTVLNQENQGLAKVEETEALQ